MSAARSESRDSTMDFWTLGSSSSRVSAATSSSRVRMRASGFGGGFDFEVDVVHADDFASINIDDLLIEEIAFEQEQTFGAVGERPVRGIGGSVDVGVDGGDGREGKYTVAGFGFNDERGDSVAVFLRSESDFADLSPGHAGRVIDGGAENFGKRQHSHPRLRIA